MKRIQIPSFYDFDVVSSPSTNRRNLIGTLTSSSPSSLPTLPFDLIPEILSRLPVKLLLQLRCVCKSWKSLISDPKFAKKHLALSTTYILHGINHKGILESYSLDSYDLIAQTHLPSNRYVYFLGSRDGLLCLAQVGVGLFLVQLWNPSIRKFKELPPVTKPQNLQNLSYHMGMYGFGYDPISDNYKVVVVLLLLLDIRIPVYTANYFSENEVKVHTLGTHSWKSVSEFPFAGFYAKSLGQYVSGTINWLVYMEFKQGGGFIASLDLGNESYQKVLPPDFGEVNIFDRLSVFRDCLCIISRRDVWVMKEYGNEETWTKLFTIPNMPYSFIPSYVSPSYSNTQYTSYIFEDDKVLLRCQEDDGTWGYITYDGKSDTSKCPEFENILEVCVESLISPVSNATM